MISDSLTVWSVCSVRGAWGAVFESLAGCLGERCLGFAKDERCEVLYCRAEN